VNVTVSWYARNEPNGGWTATRDGASLPLEGSRVEDAAAHWQYTLAATPDGYPAVMIGRPKFMRRPDEILIWAEFEAAPDRILTIWIDGVPYPVTGSSFTTVPADSTCYLEYKSDTTSINGAILPGGETGTTVSVAPAEATVAPGGTAEFDIVVEGDPSGLTAEWAMMESGGGTLAVSPEGDFPTHCVYTPSAEPGTYHILVTVVFPGGSMQDFVVTVTVLAGGAVGIAPGRVSLAPGGTQQFTATIAGVPNTDIIWSCSRGSISASGLFEAPDAGDPVVVTATSAYDPTQSASATVTVVLPPGVTRRLVIRRWGYRA